MAVYRGSQRLGKQLKGVVVRALGKPLDLSHVSGREGGRDLLAHQDHMTGNEDGTKGTRGVPALLEGQAAIGSNDLDPISWLEGRRGETFKPAALSHPWIF